MAGRRKAVATTAGKPSRSAPSWLLRQLRGPLGRRARRPPHPGLRHLRRPHGSGPAARRCAGRGGSAHRPQPGTSSTTTPVPAHARGLPSETVYDGALKAALDAKTAKSAQLEPDRVRLAGPRRDSYSPGSASSSPIPASARSSAPGTRSRKLDRGPVHRLLGHRRPHHSRHRRLPGLGKLALLPGRAEVHEFLFGLEWNPQIAMRAPTSSPAPGPSGPCRCSSAPS